MAAEELVMQGARASTAMALTYFAWNILDWAPERVTDSVHALFALFCDAEVAMFTHKLLETHGCILSTVAADALVLKHQAISSYNAD